ncbi:MAG: pyridoxal-phosphate dependent enzyme [Rhodospirillaceae bacterium]|nr:pyridoxal-phosphate dependent enzyme [Rhodospirillaceae bacterium]
MSAAATPVDAAAIAAARARIAGLVRRTPMIAVPPVQSHAGLARNLVLKLECLQVTGSFKPRGAINKLKALPADAVGRGVITASGGNHGLAVAYAGWVAGVKATIYLPETAAPDKIVKLKQWGAAVEITGSRWDEANAAALAHAERERLAYIHPFADPAVVAGQGTLGDEILDDMPQADTVIVAIGGGGLVAGVGAALKARKPDIRVIGVEPYGAPTLHDSVAAGEIVTVPKITTRAGTLAAGRTDPINFDLVRRHVERIVLVSDDEMRDAARWLWFELGIGAELSGAAAMAALIAGRYVPAEGERVCAIVCGAGADGIG